MAKKKSGGKPGYYTFREVVGSLAYRTLPVGAKALYHDLRKKFNGHNNGNISATLSQLRMDGWRSSATLAKDLQLLQDHGLLVKTQEGGIRSGSLRNCCLYAFTDLQIHADEKLGIHSKPATLDYLQFISIKSSRQKKTSLPKLTRHDSESKPLRFKLQLRLRGDDSKVEAPRLRLKPPKATVYVPSEEIEPK